MLDKDKDEDIYSASEGLGKCSFYYAQGMQKNWIETNTIFLKCVSRKFVKITKVSFMEVEIIETEMDSNKLSKFKTKAEKDEHIDSLDVWSKRNSSRRMMITRNLAGRRTKI